MKLNPKTILVIIILFIILLATLFLTILTKENKCQLDPFIYGANILKDKGMEVNCMCYPLNPLEYAPFSFNSENITVGIG